MIKILVADKLSKVGLNWLAAQEDVETAIHAGLTPEALTEIIGDYDGVIIRSGVKITDQVLVKSGRLKGIARAGVGVDNVDVPSATQRGIIVMNTPDGNTLSTAELTWALILGLSRKIGLANASLRSGKWDRKQFEGTQLAGKTLGVVGGGRIGMNVVRIARSIGMEVLVHDPKPRPELAQEMGFRYAALEEILPVADVITLHVPYLPATHHLMDHAKFAMMKKGAILVNTARGGLVDTAALIEALDEGRLSGAGLDVLEEEGCFKEEAEIVSGGFRDRCDLQALVRNHALVARHDVIITPHIAWYSREAVARILDTTVENVKGFAAGAPVNVIQTK